MLRLEVRQRTLLLDQREFVFITEDGLEVERTDTEGVVRHVERWVARHLRGSARVHGRAQLLQALRQFNSPKEGLTQFVAAEAASAARLAGLEEPARRAALDEAVVRAIQARHPVDLLSVERWVRGHGQWIGLTGKNQALGGKVRLATEGILSDFQPEKLLARSLLDKPEAFRGDTLRLKARRARHTGAVVEVVREFRGELQGAGAVLTTQELDAFEVARTTRFVPEGSSEAEQAIQRLVREFRMTESDAIEAVDLVRAPENPGEFSVWGMVNGITSASKALTYAGDRTDMSAIAGSILTAAVAAR